MRELQLGARLCIVRFVVNILVYIELQFDLREGTRRLIAFLVITCVLALIVRFLTERFCQYQRFIIFA